MNLPHHLEKYLGRIEQGWSSASLPGVQVCLFPDQPREDVMTLATLGLSNTVLEMRGTRKVRQELLFATYCDRTPDEFAQLLLHVAEEVLKTGRAPLRGDVLPLGDRVASDSHAEFFYASMPAVYPDELATMEGSDPATVIVWMIPILRAEAQFIERSGWSNFEDRLETVDPDLFDLTRSSIV